MESTVRGAAGGAGDATCAVSVAVAAKRMPATSGSEVAFMGMQLLRDVDL